MTARWEVVRQTSDKPDVVMCTHQFSAVAEVCRDRYERRDRDRVTGFHYTARRVQTGTDQPEAVET